MTRKRGGNKTEAERIARAVESGADTLEGRRPGPAPRLGVITRAALYRRMGASRAARLIGVEKSGFLKWLQREGFWTPGHRAPKKRKGKK